MFPIGAGVDDRQCRAHVSTLEVHAILHTVDGVGRLGVPATAAILSIRLRPTFEERPAPSRIAILGSLVGFAYGFGLGVIAGAAVGVIYNLLSSFRAERDTIRDKGM